MPHVYNRMSLYALKGARFSLPGAQKPGAQTAQDSTVCPKFAAKSPVCAPVCAPEIHCHLMTIIVRHNPRHIQRTIIPRTIPSMSSAQCQAPSQVH